MTMPRLLVSLAAVLVASSMPLVARADGGTFETVFSGMSNMTSLQLGDTIYASANGTGTLTVLKSSGAPFVEGVSATTRCVRFSKKSPNSFELEADCLVTFSTADSIGIIFRRKVGDVVAGSGGEGMAQLTAGTGQFAGVNGQCKYRVSNLPGESTWNVTTNQCQWQR